jgi:hypothetical protein
MAKRLTTQQKAARLHEAGHSYKEIGRMVGMSESSARRVAKGKQSGKEMSAAIDQAYKLGKRAREAAGRGEIVLPAAKPGRVPSRERAAEPTIVVRSIDRAEGAITQFPSGEKVVVHLTSKETGMSRTLYAHGGIDAGDIKRNFRREIRAQANSQYGKGAIENWDDWEIEVELY